MASDIRRYPPRADLALGNGGRKLARMVQVVVYADQHFDGVKALWEEAFPNDPPHNRAEVAIPEKLASQPDLFFVAIDAGAVVGSVMAGYDGHRGWLYAVAVHNSHRRKGVASALVQEAEAQLLELGCQKINLQVRRSNAEVVAFYEGLGFRTEDMISMGKRAGPRT